MKNQKTITILVLAIAVLSAITSLAGLFLAGGPGQHEFLSVTGEKVQIYGQGLYQNDSISTVAQGRASDLVTLVLAIPLLLISLMLAVKGAFKGKLLLIGTLGYFLYTYVSYTFLWTYNSFFLIYVALMSMSFFAFVLCFNSFDTKAMASNFKEKLPVKFLGIFQLLLAFAVSMLWLGKIAPSLLNVAAPAGLEHYTTLAIQGMDLGFVVPTAVLSGILLLKKKPLGYLLTSIVVLKGITMLTCISAMLINMALSGVVMSLAEIIIFPAFNLLAIICMVLLLKNTNNSNQEEA